MGVNVCVEQHLGGIIICVLPMVCIIIACKADEQLNLGIPRLQFLKNPKVMIIEHGLTHFWYLYQKAV